eukprot:GHVN01060444.1.p2 GENE.GHVN01060444.1~~GHVN01060444.1.p2  ORF type:complete len:101 (+),score=14.12 GHVN01060444.1:509-811(+)
MLRVRWAYHGVACSDQSYHLVALVQMPPCSSREQISRPRCAGRSNNYLDWGFKKKTKEKKPMLITTPPGPYTQRSRDQLIVPKPMVSEVGELNELKVRNG